MSPLAELTEVTPLGEADRACLDALRAVLKQHGSCDRFGITLLHQHFPIAEDEQLIETCDVPERTLTIRPETRRTLPEGRVIETSWRFDDTTDDVLESLVCKVGCFVDLRDRHERTHDRVSG